MYFCWSSSDAQSVYQTEQEKKSNNPWQNDGIGNQIEESGFGIERGGLLQ